VPFSCLLPSALILALLLDRFQRAGSTPPEITCPDDVILECPADTSPVSTGEATATDACGEVAITHEDDVTDGCGGALTIVRTWTATDECGLSSTCDQTITLVAPEFWFRLSGPVDLEGVTLLSHDWNGDGYLDLIVTNSSGDVIVFESHNGLMRLTVVVAYRLATRDLQGRVTPLKLPYVDGLPPRFDVVDWDSDGSLDLVTLDEALSLRVYLSDASEGRRDMFHRGEGVRFSEGAPLAIPVCPRSVEAGAVRVLDWDGSGSRDLLLATGECFILPGTGNWARSSYDRPAGWVSDQWCIESGSPREDLELFGLSGAHVVPWAIDWTGDSLLDIVLGYAMNTPDGQYSRVLLMVNTGTSTQHRFARERRDDSEFFLLDEQGDPLGTGYHTSVGVCDANDDGDWDLLVGGDGPLSLFVGNGSRLLSLAWTLEEMVAPD